ncbi:MAG TPA: hypothetical protein VGM33_24110 [Baekduia sp.]
MPWPPTIGQRLPRAAEAWGITDKLSAYCLNVDHAVGGPKARGFERILGVGIADVGYLTDTLRAGVREAAITNVRDNSPFGILCEVRMPVVGLGDRRDRVAAVITSWELRHAEDRPRLVTAYIDG